MRNIYKLFYFTLLFLISKTNQISVNELWENTQEKIKKEYKDKSYFFIDVNNKITENEKGKINKAMNNIFLKYGVSSYLFLINKMDEKKETFMNNLNLKISKNYASKEKNSIISLISIDDNYDYLSVGSEIEWKISQINEIKNNCLKEGYEKYFSLIVDKILDALYEHELKEDDDDWYDEDEEEEDEDFIDDEDKDKDKDKDKKKDDENNTKNNNINNSKNYGLYIIFLFLIITIIIVGIWIVHNFRRKLLNKNISSNIDYYNLTKE